MVICTTSPQFEVNLFKDLMSSRQLFNSDAEFCSFCIVKEVLTNLWFRFEAKYLDIARVNFGILYLKNHITASQIEIRIFAMFTIVTRSSAFLSISCKLVI